MEKYVTIEENAVLNEEFTTIDKKDGRTVLPCWFVDERHFKRSFLIKARFNDNAFWGNSNPRPLVSIDPFYINQEGLSSHIVATINDNGDPTKQNDVVITSKIDKTGLFEFAITFLLDQSDVSGFFYDVPRRVKLEYRVKVRYKKRPWGGVTETLETTGMLDFFIHKKLGDVWIGLDPGTSGSCVCIGGTGGSITNPNITQLGCGIIDSRVIIPKDISFKSDIRDYVPGEDYKYGAEAMQYWVASLKNGNRGFMSIKKLLGYNKEKPIMVKTANGERGFSGLDIAHLLIKGIQKEADNGISQLPEAQKKQLFDHSNVSPDRAVVAIPNNYTMPKILDMVESVKLLNLYKEVRYIYEPEAVLFNYFMNEYFNIVKKGGENVLVFDMGGATINVSLYKVSVRKDNDDEVCVVKTIGKVGYAVGGDNIDFALIETLIDLCEKASGMKLQTEQKIKFEGQYKDELLSAIFPFKLALIKAANNDYTGPFLTAGNFLQAINTIMAPLQKEYKMKPLEEEMLKIAMDIYFDQGWFDYLPTLIKKLLKSDSMQEYVLSRVREAIIDIKEYMDSESVDQMIFSGRSVRFPGIKEVVKGEMHFDGEWNGLIGNDVKTAVAKGCCWYGMFSKLIELDNELITSSYGYTMTVDGVTTFKPVIRSKSKFEYDGKFKGVSSVSSNFLHDGGVIQFYQIMGAGKEQPIENTKIYKRIYLGKIRAETKTKEIIMEIDRNDNIQYSVNFGVDELINSKVVEATNRDILDENDRAYAFATMSPVPRTIEAIQEESTSQDSIESDKEGNTVLQEESKHEDNVSDVKPDRQRVSQSSGKRTRV